MVRAGRRAGGGGCTPAHAVGQRRTRPWRRRAAARGLSRGRRHRGARARAGDRCAGLSAHRCALSLGRADAARGPRPVGHRRAGRRRTALVAPRCVVAARASAAAGLRPRYARSRTLPLRARAGRRRARDRGRAGACRHHRAGTFPLLGRRREGAAAGGAPGLRAQGHRAALHGALARGRAPARRTRLGRLGGWPIRGLSAWPRRASAA